MPSPHLPAWLAAPRPRPPRYETDNFLDKNKDFVVAEHQILLSGSSQPFVAQLFYEPADPGVVACVCV